MRADRGRLAGAFVATGTVGVDAAPRLDSSLVGLDRDAIRALLRDAYPDLTAQRLGAELATLDRFANQVRAGHAVLLPAAGTRDLVVGEVVAPYDWVEAPPVVGHHHLRPVRWHARLRAARVPDGARIGDPRPVGAVYDLDLPALTEPL